MFLPKAAPPLFFPHPSSQRDRYSHPSTNPLPNPPIFFYFFRSIDPPLGRSSSSNSSSSSNPQSSSVSALGLFGAPSAGLGIASCGGTITRKSASYTDPVWPPPDWVGSR